MQKVFLYVLSSRHHRHLSIGVTAHLSEGIRAHRNNVCQRLGKKDVLQKLVYVELMHSAEEALDREQALLRFSRRQLEELIESVNPGWDSISLKQLREAGFDR